MVKCGEVGGGYGERWNTLRRGVQVRSESQKGRGELCADEGKRKVVHHKWGLEREVTNFPTVVHWGTLGMGLYSGGGYRGDGRGVQRGR